MSESSTSAASSVPISPARVRCKVPLTRPLRHRRYRNIWLANMVSNMGTWIQTFASAWLVNQDVLPQIMKLGFAITTAAGTAAGAGAMYMAPQGLANQSAYGSLLGRPIIVTEACQTLGTVGDVILADLSKYLD